MKKHILLLITILFVFDGCQQKDPVPVIANFTTSVAADGKVIFQNTSTNADTYEWDFGNGQKSTDKNPSTQYYKNGDYTVILIAKTSKSQNTKTQKVTVGTAPKPVVNFTWANQGNGLIKFTNTSTNAESYKWTFGNQNQSTEQSPQVQYQANGIYEVILQATNSNGMTESKQNITIEGLPIIHDSNKQIIPVGGNSWLANTSEYITNDGLANWQNAQNVLSTYVRVPQSGKLKISVHAKVPDGESKLTVTIAGRSASFLVKGANFVDYMVDEWTISAPGYVKIDLKAVSKTGQYFGSIDNISISGTASNSFAVFVPNNNDNYFYWGRRGPSVHLWYDTQNLNNIEWFYNEITVPANNDVVGSYFMANGFREGYFGMQVNSPTERKILFSVWSPSNEDDPNKIPEAMKIKLLRKGAGVTTGEFGGEGAGGQSYLNYNWKTGNTYKFLTRGRPIANNYTEYTSYFYAPEEGNWRLIASFSRPMTNTYLMSLYSFLESFYPDWGNRERLFNLTNQWGYSDGKWIELNKVLYTGGDIYRLDYAGGLSNGQFYLRNCGFFNDYVPVNRNFTRPTLGVAPSIDFNRLP